MSLPLPRSRRAALALAAVAALAWALERPAAPPDAQVPDAVLRFEEQDLARFAIRNRPDGVDLSFRRVDGEWVTEGRPWRPSRAMVRRAAHQLHDLTARADVAEAGEADLERYGLGPSATEVELGLSDGRTLRLAIGGRNPTGTSAYVRPLPDGGVYLVKASAAEPWTAPMEAFREDRLASFEEDEVLRLVAVVDGRPLEVERAGPAAWRMLRPVEQPASHDEVRRLLGRLSALRAAAFEPEEGDRPDPSRGLEPPLHAFRVEAAGAEPWELRLGAPVEGRPGLRHAWVGGRDEQGVQVRDGLLEAFRRPAEAFRETRLLPGLRAGEVVALVVETGGASLALARSGGAFRWPDGGVVAGATPERLAEAATGLRAADPGEAPPPGAETSWATVRLRLADGSERRVELGEPGPGGEALAARVDGGAPARVDEGLAEAVEDLLREHARRAERRGDGPPRSP